MASRDGREETVRLVLDADGNAYTSTVVA